MSKSDDMAELRERLDFLKREIHFHNYRYHVLDSPIISDYEYDQLVTELAKIETDHPELITPDSPSQRAGARPLDKFVKVRHPAPILSLSNAFDKDGVQAWYDRISKLDERVCEANFVVEPKIDGLTVVLHYRDGMFILGATRGDGDTGEDITANLKTIRALPMRIPIAPDGRKPPSYLVIRGEAFIPLRDFELLNQRLEAAGERTYFNPRNTAAGALRQLDPGLTATRPLTLFAYAIIVGEGELPRTQWDSLHYLHALGFPIPEAYLCKNLSEVYSKYQELLSRRGYFEYEADGIVIKVNDLHLADELGFVGKDPRGALAYKYPARELTTQLMDIGVNVGRTGRLTPYAILSPVEIGGVIVKQATLHNFDYIAEKDIRIGDRVAVKRAGDVIPYVIGPILEARDGSEDTYQPPINCPTCGSIVERNDSDVDWYCVSSSCPAQLVRNIEHFVSRGAMDIVGMGIKIVEQLVDAHILTDVADLYTIRKEDLLQLDGFAEKKANNLIEAINNSKNRSLSRVITALGIRGVGEVVASDLSRYFPDLDLLFGASYADLQKAEGVGPIVARSVIEWFNKESNRKILSKLKAANVQPIDEKRQLGRHLPFSEMSFVVTGALAGFTREGIKEYIISLGGKVSDSVSKNTTYLVAGESPGSKLNKARDLGIPIIDAENLRKLAGEGERHGVSTKS